MNKQRRQDHNLLQQAGQANKPVEVGAIWTTPAPGAGSKNAGQADVLHAGHFFVTPAQPASALTMKSADFASVLSALPVRWRKDLH